MLQRQPRGVTVAQLVLVQLAQVRILAGLPFWKFFRAFYPLPSKSSFRKFITGRAGFRRHIDMIPWKGAALFPGAS